MSAGQVLTRDTEQAAGEKWADGFVSDTLAARPAAAESNKNVLYFATDVRGGVLYRSTGAEWVEVTGGLLRAGPQIVPADLGYLSWAYDPATTPNVTIPTAGLMQVVRVPIWTPMEIKELHLDIGVAGSENIANCYMALYDTAGKLLAQSADKAAEWKSTGRKDHPITPQAVAAGFVDVAFWWGSGTTGPSIARGSTQAGAGNGKLSANTARFATADSGLTTTAPGTRAAKVAVGTCWWVGVS